MRQWDPVSLMAAVAGVTRSAAVGSTVLDVGPRQPIDLARMAATVASISAGGCELGLGAGWARHRRAGRMDRCAGGGAGTVADDFPHRQAGRGARVGAADRYLEAFAESVVRPLTGR